MKKETEEILTGIAIVLILTLLFAVKVFAAPVSEEEEAERFLEENGIDIPEEIEFWCEKYGNDYDICPETLEAMCWVESRCIPSAQNYDKSCKGLMQVKPSCHQERMEKLGVRNIFGVWENIKVGTDYLAELRDDNGDIAAALYIYNGNSTGTEKYMQTKQVTGYAKKVLEISEALERAHEK